MTTRARRAPLSLNRARRNGRSNATRGRGGHGIGGRRAAPDIIRRIPIRNVSIGPQTNADNSAVYWNFSDVSLAARPDLDRKTYVARRLIIEFEPHRHWKRNRRRAPEIDHHGSPSAR